MSTPRPILLPKPYPSDTYAVGQLLDANEAVDPDILTHKDFDDTHVANWYKDIISVGPSGFFTASLGGEHLVETPAPGTQLVCLEAEKMAIRCLKNPEQAFAKTCAKRFVADWLKDMARKSKPVYFVTAVQEVENASLKPASFVDAGNGLAEVVTKMDNEESKRRRKDSGFDEPTGSKTDVVGVELRKVLVWIDDLINDVPELDCRWLPLNTPEGVHGEDRVAVGLGDVVEDVDFTMLWE